MNQSMAIPDKVLMKSLHLTASELPTSIIYVWNAVRCASGSSIPMKVALGPVNVLGIIVSRIACENGVENSLGGVTVSGSSTSRPTLGVELFISRLRCREIRLHAFLLHFRRCHCFLQTHHHIHEFLNGHLFTLCARRTLSRGSHHLEFLLAVVQPQRVKELELGQTRSYSDSTKAIGENCTNFSLVKSRGNWVGNCNWN